MILSDGGYDRDGALPPAMTDQVLVPKMKNGIMSGLFPIKPEGNSSFAQGRKDSSHQPNPRKAVAQNSSLF